jgi:hypothetical protein
MSVRIFPPHPRGPQTAPRALSLDIESLLQLLGEGKQDRAILAMKMGVRDRRMRMAVEAARAGGEMVLWGDGYYRLATSRMEYDVWEELELNSRITRLLQQRSAMRRRRDVTWPEQMKLTS